MGSSMPSGSWPKLPRSISAEMSLCPESAKRAAMTDGEFWEYVLLPSWERNPRIDHYAFGADREEVDLMSNIATPCPECGQLGPCGYDNEARPYIHTTEER